MPLNEHPLSFDVAAQRCHGILHLPVAGNGPHPCVLLLHGFTGTHLEPHRLFVLMARQLAAAGIAAYRFSYRGSGDSEGLFSDMTLTRQLEDVRAALRLLEGRSELDRSKFGLLGLSMGGLMAGLTAGVETVRALCLWAPATPQLMVSMAGQSAEGIRTMFASGFSGRQFPPGIRFDAASGYLDLNGNPVAETFFLDALQHDSLESAARHTGASLVVHGTDDPTVPLAVGQQYAAALKTELHAIPGAGHTFDSLPFQAEVHRVSLEFFQRSL